MRVEDYISSGVLEQYVMGELSPTEEKEVAQMADLHPEVRHEISQIEDTQQAIAETLAVQPPDHILDNILARISEETERAVPIEPEPESPPARKQKKIHYLQYGVAASFTLKLVAMAVAAHFWVQWQQADDRLVRLQDRYENLEQESQQVTQALIAVSDPDFQTLVLRAEGSDASHRALVYWNANTLDVYVNPSNLPQNSQDQQYQLWGITEGQPQSLGVFDVSGQSTLPRMITMEGADNLSAFAITLEPAGGSSSPSPESPAYQSTVE